MMNQSMNNNGNGNHGKSFQNGNGKGSYPKTGLKMANYQEESESNQTSVELEEAPFDRQVVLRQSPVWARAVAFTIMGITTFGIIWASVAKIEQVVPARGQLKPQGEVKEVQSPINGVVKEVFVKEGDHVEEGQLLLVLDSQASAAQLKSLEMIQGSLEQENKFYRSLINQPLDKDIAEKIEDIDLPPEVTSLAQNRSELISENQLFRILLGESIPLSSLNSEQLLRLQAARSEFQSRVMVRTLEVNQLQKQFRQNQVQLNDTRSQLATDRVVLDQIKSRNERSLSQGEQSLAIEEKILENLQPLVNEGAVARIQLERQQLEVNDRHARLIEQKATGGIEFDRQEQQIETRLAEIDNLLEEQQRLQYQVSQAEQELENTKAQTRRDLRDRIAVNKQRIAEIDSQLNKILVENDKRIAELYSEIKSAQVTLNYQEIRSPVSGTVFDLKASPGFVPQPNQAEPLLKIVPNDKLIAEVFITNEDIGFVGEGQATDVRIDTFPFSEFGDIKGEVISIGSDALEPDQVYNYYRFPAKVSLDRQKLVLASEREIDLQSGMSVSVNIKVRENRTVLSIFTELFSNQVIEPLKKAK